MLVDKHGNKIEKGLAYFDNSLVTSMDYDKEKDQRGYSVYTLSQLMGITGKGKDGNYIHGTYEQSLYYLTIDERNAIYKLCSPVLGVVSNRQNLISGLNWKITRIKDKEDLIYERLKNYKQIYDEYKNSTELKYVIVKARILQYIKEYLIDVLPDLSNFQSSLIRWKKRIEHAYLDQAEIIEAWLENPNTNDTWEEWIKKVIYDLLIHGSVAIYKEQLSGKIENFYTLPGGSVFPLQSKYINGINAYVQIMQGEEPQIYFSDELAYMSYLPSSARAYGNIPLEALINKITESLMFDKLMADQADGTKLPEKVVIIGNNNPFGVLQENFVPLDLDEQKRMETKLNQPKKGAVVTFSGNSAVLLDLTRENTMGVQIQRQKDIREDVALVFGASNIEMNLTGSENTSGRETSETQLELVQSRANLSLCNIISSIITKTIIPYRFGCGYMHEFELGKNEKENLENLQRKVITGIYTVNELREEQNLDVFNQPEYDKPIMSQKQEQQEKSGLESLL